MGTLLPKLGNVTYSDKKGYFEIGRQKKKDLVGIFTPGGLNTIWHELGGLEGAHVAYVGVEMRGLFSTFRRDAS